MNPVPKAARRDELLIRAVAILVEDTTAAELRIILDLLAVYLQHRARAEREQAS